MDMYILCNIVMYKEFCKYENNYTETDINHVSLITICSLKDVISAEHLQERLRPVCALTPDMR